MQSGRWAPAAVFQGFCRELGPGKSLQGWDAGARRLRTALFMLLQNVHAGLVFLDD